VVTNPPYMGSRNMDRSLADYVAVHYRQGSVDLYAAFIMRCISSCLARGRTAMVPPQTWMLKGSFSDLRSSPPHESKVLAEPVSFHGLLITCTFEAIVQLGRHAFSEADPPSAPVLFVLRRMKPSAQHAFWACRLIESRPSHIQEALLRGAIQADRGKSSSIFSANQLSLLAMPNSPFAYWLDKKWISLIAQGNDVARFAQVLPGLKTGDDQRFLRYQWRSMVFIVGGTATLRQGSDRADHA